MIKEITSKEIKDSTHPVNEGTLGIHEIELVINTTKGLGNSSCVSNANSDRTLQLMLRPFDFPTLNSLNDSF